MSVRRKKPYARRKPTRSSTCFSISKSTPHDRTCKRQKRPWTSPTETFPTQTSAHPLPGEYPAIPFSRARSSPLVRPSYGSLERKGFTSKEKFPNRTSPRWFPERWFASTSTPFPIEHGREKSPRSVPAVIKWDVSSECAFSSREQLKKSNRECSLAASSLCAAFSMRRSFQPLP